MSQQVNGGLDKNTARLGAVCGTLAAIGYVALAIIYFMLPHNQRPGGGYSEGVFLRTGPQGYQLLMGEMWAISLSAIFAIGAIIAVSEYMKRHNEGLVKYTTTLAIIGCSALAVTYLLDQWHTPQLLDGYQHLDASGRGVLEVIGTRHLDPQAIWGFGMVGLWFLVVNGLGLQKKVMPRWLALLGLVVGVAYLCVTVGRITVNANFIQLAASLGGVAGPIWYVSMGLFLVSPRREEQPAPAVGAMAAVAN
jgi:hypothetical protein